MEQLDPSRPEERYESFVAFWRKKGKTWKCLECIGGADLVVLEENTGMSIEEWLQDRYPDSPSEIFE